MKKNILVSGGAGYIGSHTCVALLESGYSVIVADNLSNSKPDILERIHKITNSDIIFYKTDVTDSLSVKHIFEENQIYGVIHCAGFKAVGESVKTPLTYYRNNLLSTIELAKACIEHNVKNFVFSSSATVYGENHAPFTENMPLMPATNPYGETKIMSEKILRDTTAADEGFSVSLLRYFNPVGAHESGFIGEDPNGIPSNLMPYITKVAKGQLALLRVFGNDYDTPDGTGIRDYIHVMDLAEGHVAALANMKPGVSVYNLGTGKGTSVLELIHAFERTNGIKIPYTITQRRPGDIAICYAAAEKAERELNWKARRTIDDMCRDAWRFECNNKREVSISPSKEK